MAEGDAPVVAKVAPFQRYYMCIDGTGAGDSVEYGRLLESKFGWRNLVGEFLGPDPNAGPGDTDRLHDPNHPFLPICTFPASGRKKPIAVVCPNGRNAFGLDKFWEKYIGEEPDERANQGKKTFDRGGGITSTFFGRHSAAFKSGRFMNDLILVPAIEKITDDQGNSFAQLKQGRLIGSFNPSDPDIPAELLIVSSHGWLGGYMAGDTMKESKVAEPDEAKKLFNPPRYFLIGRALEENDIFVGPKWIILAQCSTINNATAPMWAKLMANSFPPIRGILGYEEVSPGVSGSITIAREFFDNLKAGKPMLKAWRAANLSEKWSAIIHKEALGDLMTKWDSLSPLSGAAVEAKQTTYLMFARSIEKAEGDKGKEGKEIFDAAAPFGLKFERFFPADPTKTPPLPEQFVEITPATLDRRRSSIEGDAQYRSTLTAPAGSKIASATIRWIHMRETSSIKPPISKLFDKFEAFPAGSLQLTISSKDARTLEAKPAAGPLDSLAVDWTAQSAKELDRSGLERDHSYLWMLIKIETDAGESLSFPFSTQGLGF